MIDSKSIAEINPRIFFIRNHRVMLDQDIAFLYEVKTKDMNKAVRRNKIRFPEDFMFQLTEKEEEFLNSQINSPMTEQEEKRGGRRS